MLVAYFDESGTHDPSVAVGMTGLIGQAADWSAMVDQWSARLAEDGIRVFHAFDCANRRNEFDDPRKWNQAKIDLIFGDLGRLINGGSFGLIGMQVSSASWRSAFPNGPSSFGLTTPPPNPYAFCFGSCIAQAVEWSEQHHGGEPIDLVFGVQAEYEDDARQVVEQFMSDPRTRDKIQSISFQTTEEAVPLQAADLLAFQLYRTQQEIDNCRLVEIRPLYNTLDSELGRSADLRLATARHLRAVFLQPVELACLPLCGHLLPLIEYQFRSFNS